MDPYPVLLGINDELAIIKRRFLPCKTASYEEENGGFFTIRHKVSEYG